MAPPKSPTTQFFLESALTSWRVFCTRDQTSHSPLITMCNLSKMKPSGFGRVELKVLPWWGLVDLREGAEVPLLLCMGSRSGLWCMGYSFSGTLGACGAATLAQEGYAKVGVTVLAWHGEEGKNCPPPQSHTTLSLILPEITLKVPSGKSLP